MTHNETKSSSAAALRATVHGHVQGVFFRGFVRDHARRLGLVGFVRNQPDGTVYVEAHGDRDQLERLLDLLWRGPVSARVSRVEHEWLDAAPGADDTGFEVRD